jgi:TPR repeat protein
MPIAYLFNFFKKWKNKIEKSCFETELSRAQQGDAKAQCYVAMCYVSGRGVNINHQQAFKWFEKSAHQDHSKAQYYLSSCFAFGKGIKQDPNKASYWLKAAADQGYKSAIKLIDKTQ